jgi:hypothetical protein
MKEVQVLATKLLTDLDDLNSSERSPTQNIQTLWAQFKFDVAKYGKYCSRFITNDSTRQIRTWKTQLTLVLHDDDIPLQDKSEAIYMLENKIRKSLEEEAENKKASVEARYDVEGETLRTKSWTRSAKCHGPKESINEFKKNSDLEEPVPSYEVRPKEMAKMARDYHNSIQFKDQPDEYGGSWRPKLPWKNARSDCQKRNLMK